MGYIVCSSLNYIFTITSIFFPWNRKLPNSIKKTDLEVCLFVKDLDRTEREYEATIRHFQDLMKKKGVKSIPEVC